MTGRSLKGLVALVTGGASGLGLATIERLVKQGASAVLCDLPASKGSSVAQRIGEKCIFAPSDVTSESDVKNALDLVKEKFGRLDVAVNCAGTNLTMRTYDFVAGTPHSLESFISMMQVKTSGTFNVTRLAAQMMAKNSPNEMGERGVIVNTSDICAYEGRQGYLAYSASCAAVAYMTLPLARDLASENIRCCTIAPGSSDQHGDEDAKAYLSKSPLTLNYHRDEVAKLYIRYVTCARIQLSGKVTFAAIKGGTLGRGLSSVCTANGFSQKSNLKNHMLMHMGEKPYECELCTQKFWRKYNLEHHRSVHSRPSHHVCTMCCATFRNHLQLTQHLNVHETGNL